MIESYKGIIRAVHEKDIISPHQNVALPRPSDANAQSQQHLPPRPTMSLTLTLSLFRLRPKALPRLNLELDPTARNCRSPNETPVPLSSGSSVPDSMRSKIDCDAKRKGC